MDDPDFDTGDDGISPTLNIHLKAIASDVKQRISPGLLFPAAKVLHRVGGELLKPREPLLDWDGMQISRLGAGLVTYAAVTIAAIPDDRFFQTGELLELGENLASSARVLAWTTFLRERYPDLVGVAGLEVDLSPLEPGSFQFRQRIVPILQGVAAVTTIMAGAPTAYKHATEIYIPAAVQAIQASREFAEQYSEGLKTLLDAEIKLRPAQAPNLEWKPDADRRRRYLID